MSPEQARIQELENKVKKLIEVLDVPFIENVKRRCVTPTITDLGLGDAVSKTGAGNTSGVLKSVSEAGSGSYSVADAYDGTITVRDTDGTSYKLGYYTP
jgi:hypothetical protein